jgi:hypothetical protein
MALRCCNVRLGNYSRQRFCTSHQLTAYRNVLTPDNTGADWQLRFQWTFLFPEH